MFEVSPFSIPANRPWPLTASFIAFGLTLNSVYFFYIGYSWWSVFSFIFLLFISFQWLSDIVKENQEGFHTFKVSSNIRFGMILFIISEILFFFAFFWSYFHICLGPTVKTGFQFPPFLFSEIIVDPFGIPLLNTMVLISSGVRITWCHHSILNSNFNESLISLTFTIILGVYFMFLQVGEYIKRKVKIKSTVFGTVFFLLTGFHGFHVTIGIVLLSVCLFRLGFLHFKKNIHVGFEISAWYWHFVDVVWIFLYLFVYLYGK